MDSGSPFVGIDFGTTNSSVAYAHAGRVDEVQFAAAGRAATESTTGTTDAGLGTTWRSLLYLQRAAHSLTKPLAVWTGADAVEQYLATDSFDEAVQGRLIQSLKSHLAARDLTGTEVFGRPYRFEELVARILRDIRLQASRSLGFEVTRAVAGRPVVFVGAETEEDNRFAEERLRQSFREAGFHEVRFALEPVAAAYTYRSAATEDEILLIGDFGGGTTDFSLLRVHPAHMAQPPEVLGSSGVPLAGDAFDARIVRRLISPALGSESMARSLGKVLPALPAWVYSRLEHWHTLSFLRTRTVRDMIRAAGKQALEPGKLAALEAVVEHDLGYRLHQAVQRLKVQLSREEHADFLLDSEALHLQQPVRRSEFESWIAPELQRMEASLDGLLRSAAIPSAQVSRVFLTGGTSLVPAVRRLFTERFGQECVQQGEAFTSVAQGLARVAASQASAVNLWPGVSLPQV